MTTGHPQHSGAYPVGPCSHGIRPPASMHCDSDGPAQIQPHHHKPCRFPHDRPPRACPRFLSLLREISVRLVFFRACHVRFHTNPLFFRVTHNVLGCMTMPNSSFSLVSNSRAVNASFIAHVRKCSLCAALTFGGAPLRGLSSREDQPAARQCLRRS